MMDCKGRILQLMDIISLKHGDLSIFFTSDYLFGPGKYYLIIFCY
jgi:hypothetical protein